MSLRLVFRACTLLALAGVVGPVQAASLFIGSYKAEVVVTSKTGADSDGPDDIRLKAAELKGKVARGSSVAEAVEDFRKLLVAAGHEPPVQEDQPYACSWLETYHSRDGIVTLKLGDFPGIDFQWPDGLSFNGHFEAWDGYYRVDFVPTETATVKTVLKLQLGCDEPTDDE